MKGKQQVPTKQSKLDLLLQYDPLHIEESLDNAIFTDLVKTRLVTILKRFRRLVKQSVDFVIMRHVRKIKSASSSGQCQKLEAEVKLFKSAPLNSLSSTYIRQIINEHKHFHILLSLLPDEFQAVPDPGLWDGDSESTIRGSKTFVAGVSEVIESIASSILYALKGVQMQSEAGSIISDPKKMEADESVDAGHQKIVEDKNPISSPRRSSPKLYGSDLNLRSFQEQKTLRNSHGESDNIDCSSFDSDATITAANYNRAGFSLPSQMDNALCSSDPEPSSNKNDEWSSGELDDPKLSNDDHLSNHSDVECNTPTVSNLVNDIYTNEIQDLDDPYLMDNLSNRDGSHKVSLTVQSVPVPNDFDNDDFFTELDVDQPPLKCSRTNSNIRTSTQFQQQQTQSLNPSHTKRKQNVPNQKQRQPSSQIPVHRKKKNRPGQLQRKQRFVESQRESVKQHPHNEGSQPQNAKKTSENGHGSHPIQSQNKHRSQHPMQRQHVHGSEPQNNSYQSMRSVPQNQTHSRQPKHIPVRSSTSDQSKLPPSMQGSKQFPKAGAGRLHPSWEAKRIERERLANATSHKSNLIIFDN